MNRFFAILVAAIALSYPGCGVGERWKPFERPVDNPGQSVDRKAAELQTAALG